MALDFYPSNFGSILTETIGVRHVAKIALVVQSPYLTRWMCPRVQTGLCIMLNYLVTQQ